MMQTDVSSAHVKTSGQVVGFKSRLKAVVLTPGTSGIRQVAFIDSTSPSLTGTWSRSTTTVTITTSTNHGLTSGDYVAIDFSSAGASNIRDGVYTVTVTGLTTFTVVSVTSGSDSGTCAVFYNSSIICQLDTFSTIGVPVLIPGEGILCSNGIYVVLGSNVTVTVYYG
jgi:hypothetical protein